MDVYQSFVKKHRDGGLATGHNVLREPIRDEKISIVIDSFLLDPICR